MRYLKLLKSYLLFLTGAVVLTGCSAGNLVSKPAVVDFGETWVGLGSATQTAHWENSGAGAVTVAAKASDLSAPFYYANRPGGLPAVLVDGGKDTPDLQFYFVPDKEGEFRADLPPLPPKNAGKWVSNTDRGMVDFLLADYYYDNIVLKGKGVALKEIGFLSLEGEYFPYPGSDTPAKPVDFGSMVAGQSSSLMLSLRNKSASDLMAKILWMPDKDGVKLNRSSAHFSVSDETGQAVEAVLVPANDAIKLTVTFTPPVNGEFYEVLVFQDGELTLEPVKNDPNFKMVTNEKKFTSLAGCVLHGKAVALMGNVPVPRVNGLPNQKPGENGAVKNDSIQNK